MVTINVDSKSPESEIVDGVSQKIQISKAFCQKVVHKNDLILGFENLIINKNF